MKPSTGRRPKRCRHGKVATTMMRKVSPGEGAAGDYVLEAEDYTCHHSSKEIVLKFGTSGCEECPEFVPRDE